MSQEAVEKVLGRLLTDDFFRGQAKDSLRAACREEGFILSEEELRLVGGLDLKHLDHISGRIDRGIKRFINP